MATIALSFLVVLYVTWAVINPLFDGEGDPFVADSIEGQLQKCHAELEQADFQEDVRSGKISSEESSGAHE